MQTRIDLTDSDNVLITIHGGLGVPMHQEWCTPDEALLLARQIHDALEDPPTN